MRSVPIDAARPRQTMAVLDPFGDDLRRAAGLHGDAEQAVAGLHRALLVADDEQLRSLAELGDEAEEAVQVDVVERGLDLVHHVERRRAAAEHGEQERQRGEAALATRQQRQLLDVLAARLGLDLDARVEQVVGLGEHELAGAAGEQHREQLVKLAPTSAKAAANTVWISRSTALITRTSSRRVSRTSSSCSSRNVCRSWSSLNSSSASGLIGPSSRSSRSSSRTRAGGVDALGQRRASAPPRRRRVRCRDRGAASRPRSRAAACLGLLDARARRACSRTSSSCRSALGRAAAQLVEAGGERAHLVALPAALLGELGVLGLDHVAMRGRRARRAGRAARASARSRLALLGLGAGAGIGLQPALGLVDAPFEELLALVQTGVAHFEIPADATPAPRLGLRARRGPRPRASAASASACSSASSAGSRLRARRCGRARADALGRARPRPRSSSRSRRLTRDVRPAPGPVPRKRR